jgi:hypothetical protein
LPIFNNNTQEIPKGGVFLQLPSRARETADNLNMRGPAELIDNLHPI